VSSSNRPCEFQKRQLFTGTHNETPSIAAMGVTNPDYSSAENQQLY
jgi:hypothetical protein